MDESAGRISATTRNVFTDYSLTGDGEIVEVIRDRHTESLVQQTPIKKPTHQSTSIAITIIRTLRAKGYLS